MAQVQVMGADPAIVASNVYNKVLENERTRVFDVRFKPGDKAIMHGHPDHVVFILTDGKVNLAFPDGNSQQIDMKAGAALWMPAGQHETTNIGKSEVRLLVFELK